MRNFVEFIDHKHREAVTQLETLKNVLENNNFKVRAFLENKDGAYLYVSSPINLSFGGIRIYKIGDDFAYRICQRDTTQPYGEAYSLSIEKMIKDFAEDDKINENDILSKIEKSIVAEINNFFKQSFEAEQKQFDSPNGASGQIAIRTISSDYSSTMTSNDR